MINKALFSSNTEEWATPQAFFEELNKEFNFTLDPCATQENAKCKKYFTKDQNGLLQSWAGETVFCNPPYGINVVRGDKIGCDKPFGSVGGCNIVKTNKYMAIKGDETTDTARLNFEIVKELSENQIILAVTISPTSYLQRLVGAFGIKKTRATLLMLKWRGLLLTRAQSYIVGFGMVFAEKAKERLRENQEFIPHRNPLD